MIDNNLPPGVAVFKDKFFLSDEDINVFYEIFESEEYNNSLKSLNVKNILWNILYKKNKTDIIKNIQKELLVCLAEYVDLYEESVHTLQWQERIVLNVLNPGEKENLFNPCKSDNLNNSIPFSRSLVAEIELNNNYTGGDKKWLYFKDASKKNENNCITIYPASFLYSNSTSNIIDGRKIFLRTFFNGGKDFLIKDSLLEDNENAYMFSYLR